MGTALSGNEFQAHKAGSVIAGVQGALPEHRYAQHEITETLAALPAFKDYGDALRQFHASSKVDSRYLVLPLEQYAVARPTSAMRTTSGSRTQWSSAARRCLPRSTRRACGRKTST